MAQVVSQTSLMFVVKHAYSVQISASHYGPKWNTLSQKVSSLAEWFSPSFHDILLRKNFKNIHYKVPISRAQWFYFVCLASQHEPQTPSTLWATDATTGISKDIRCQKWGLKTWLCFCSTVYFLGSPCRTDWHTGFTVNRQAKGKYSTLGGTLESLKHLCKQTYIFKIPASHLNLLAYLMFGKCGCFLSHLWSMHSGSPVASLLVHQRSLLDVMGCSWGRTNLLQLAGFF